MRRLLLALTLVAFLLGADEVVAQECLIPEGCCISANCTVGVGNILMVSGTVTCNGKPVGDTTVTLFFTYFDIVEVFKSFTDQTGRYEFTITRSIIPLHGKARVTVADCGACSEGASNECSFGSPDTTPPTITCPADMTVEATSPAGAEVTFTPIARDDRDPFPIVSCTPPSGSTFPLGTTTVTCTATDASGNSASCSFTVTVADLILTQDPLVRGQQAQFQVTGANPGEEVLFLFSSVGVGDGPCFEFLGGLCLDLLNPRLLGGALADDSGTATLTRMIPATAPLIDIHTQAVVVRGEDSVKSNTTTAPILP